jgi:hypothetical protein
MCSGTNPLPQLNWAVGAGAGCSRALQGCFVHFSRLLLPPATRDGRNSCAIPWGANQIKDQTCVWKRLSSEDNELELPVEEQAAGPQQDRRKF